MHQTLGVNTLPMRTYRWLKMNHSAMDWEEAESFSALLPDPVENIPAALTVEEDADRSRLLDIFHDEIETIKQGDHAAIKPNGDAFVASSQPVPTGMGIRIDALMEHAGIKSCLYTVEEGAKLTDPLLLRFAPENGSHTLARQIIHVKKGASVTILMDYYTHRTHAGCFGIQTHLFAEEGATVRLVTVQMLGGGFIHFDDIGAVVQDNASFDYIRLEFGSDKAFSGLCANLLGDDASFTAEAAYLARRKQQYDYNYVATHRGKRTRGVMHFHGVLLDQSEKMLRGTIDFRAGAVDADGEENEDVLLLSDAAVNRTIPIILCQEEHINGHHGATIGQLSGEMLFYMQSRGFSEEEAKKLMIRAKIMRVMNLLPDGDLKSHVNAYLCDTL